MAGAWESEFSERMRSLEAQRPIPGGRALSLKVRAPDGCFHREHSPHAYALIDDYLSSTHDDGSEFEFVEHESGPEVLLLMAGAVGLAREVVGLITAILESRNK